MKKIVIAATLCSNFLVGNIVDYKQGFEAAIDSMRLQINLNNTQPERITFKEENILYIDISTLDSTSVLLIQHLANINSFQEVYLSKDKLFLGSYEREADSKKYREKAESLTGEKVYIVKRVDLDNHYTNPLFFKEFYSSLVKDNKSLVIKEPIYIEKQPVKKVVKKPTIKPEKTFTLLYGKAQSYKLNQNNANFASHFSEQEIINSPAKYIFEKSVITKDGKTFVKVRNANMYFLKEDVRF